MHIYDLTVPQLSLALRNLDRWLDRAAKHAETKSIPAETLLNARLAPDQYTFVQQVRTACDNAKFIPARLAGKQAPTHPDTEATIPELKARIASVVEYLQTFKREELDNALDSKIKLPWMQGTQHLLGADYAVQFGMPNFYFHLVTGYSILRNQGVQLGKMDFIGPINLKS